MVEPINPGTQRALHVVCERDVGLFALVVSVIPHVHLALAAGRIPVVYYGQGTCYWTPNGYEGSDTVWEYYFEPVVPGYSVASLPRLVRETIRETPPDRRTLGYWIGDVAFVTSHPTAEVRLGPEGPKKPGEVGIETRRLASSIVRENIRPRAYLRKKAERFFDEALAGRFVIGVHIRGTDALVDPNRIDGAGRIPFRGYFRAIDRLLSAHPDARILVASDAQASIERVRARYGARVVAYDAIRHEEGDLAGRGPTGRIMPAYLTLDRDLAARSGEEAVVEYLLLCRCNCLLHNGSSIPRAVLLTVPEMPAVTVRLPAQRLRETAGAWRRRTVGWGARAIGLARRFVEGPAC